MKQLLTHHWKGLLSSLFALSAFVFWYIPGASILSYQEQYQLFLFSPEYFCERISVPGGLADYISEFLVQFYYIPILGAAILALCYTAIQRLTWTLCRRLGCPATWYALSFISAIALWFYMSDESVLLSFSIAIIAALCAIVGYHAISHDNAFPTRKWQKTIFLLILIPLFYWLFGASVWIVAAYVAGYELTKSGTPISFSGSILVLAYTAILIYALSYCLQYPLYRLIGGINYYRYPAFIPLAQWVVMALVAFIPLLACRLYEPRKNRIWQALSVFIVAATGCSALAYGYTRPQYELIDYEYLVRNEQWDAIIEKATQRQPSSPMSVACVNLALSQRDQLSERLFDFFQNGAEGLFPSFSRDMTSPVSTAEIYFRLGMVNEALRYMFEAQEAIPNFRKSGRLTRRIIECEIANGQYAVATKYLRRLKQSLFYRQWATWTLQLIADKSYLKVNQPYSQLRSIRQQKTDFLFSDREMDQMLGLLFVGNYQNKMAYEYLMCYELLQGDVERFMKYYPLGKYVDYTHIPKTFQEVLVGVWLQQHGSLEGIPYSLDKLTVENTLNFIGTYMRNPKAPELAQPPLSTNAWHYLLINSQKQEKQGKQKMQLIY
uniref:DUF6057 family protein n=1 Tax=Prevotella sp. GTC17259 TaxID=3236795 RepID=A0AB33J8Z4_9BACT